MVMGSKSHSSKVESIETATTSIIIDIRKILPGLEDKKCSLSLIINGVKRPKNIIAVKKNVFILAVSENILK